MIHVRNGSSLDRCFAPWSPVRSRLGPLVGLALASRGWGRWQHGCTGRHGRP